MKTLMTLICLINIAHASDALDSNVLEINHKNLINFKTQQNDEWGEETNLTIRYKDGSAEKTLKIHAARGLMIDSLNEGLNTIKNDHTLLIGKVCTKAVLLIDTDRNRVDFSEFAVACPK